MRQGEEWRFEVRLISNQAFAQYMTHRDETVRSLASKVDDGTRKMAAKNKTVRPTRSRSLIGHLRSGRRTECPPAVARIIEDALGAPAGSLFVPRVSRVSTDAEKVSA